MAKLTIEIEK